MLLAQLYQRSQLQRGSLDLSLKCTLVLPYRWDCFLEERTFFWLLGNQGDFWGWEFSPGIFLLPRGVKSENVGLIGKSVKQEMPSTSWNRELQQGIELFAWAFSGHLISTFLMGGFRVYQGGQTTSRSHQGVVEKVLSGLWEYRSR